MCYFCAISDTVFYIPGVGGFGEIYLASDEIDRPVDNSATYVLKVEPHSNGPLFAEMHCYMRIAKPEHIEAWKAEKRLRRLGMPKYHGSGSFEHKNNKYRFMVMDRFGLDLQKILEQHSKRLSFKTVYQIGIQIVSTVNGTLLVVDGLFHCYCIVLHIMLELV